MDPDSTVVPAERPMKRELMFFLLKEGDEETKQCVNEALSVIPDLRKSNTIICTKKGTIQSESELI